MRWKEHCSTATNEANLLTFLYVEIPYYLSPYYKVLLGVDNTGQLLWYLLYTCFGEHVRSGTVELYSLSSSLLGTLPMMFARWL